LLAKSLNKLLPTEKNNKKEISKEKVEKSKEIEF